MDPLELVKLTALMERTSGVPDKGGDTWRHGEDFLRSALPLKEGGIILHYRT